MPKIIAVIRREGFVSHVVEHEDLSVVFTADADIDADGANGQFGAQSAYTTFDKGSEFLGNGGMRWNKQIQKVEPNSSWYDDIVILDEGKKSIREFADGLIASKTAYVWPKFELDDPAAYVDSETIPYIVVPPEIVRRVVGVVMGCRAICKNTKNGRIALGMVGDVGPRRKIGEVSIEMARQLGIPHSPRSGGVDEPIIEYTLFPGIPAVINGKKVALMKAGGGYVV